MIEAVTGRQADEEITRRVVAPLGLMDTYFPAPGDAGLRAPLAHGYHSFMAKPFGGPAISMTRTQSPDAASPATDPHGEIMSALLCPQ